MTRKDTEPCQVCGSIDNATDAVSSLGSACEEIAKQPLLLHSCCGPCSTSVIERLVSDYDITVYFYNPCITDRDEYEKRKANQMAFIEKYNLYLGDLGRIGFMDGVYQPQEYEKLVEGYEDEPEGGSRCSLCFRQRLEKTATMARAKGFGVFTTTLTVSPHKNYPLISAIGKAAAEKCGVEFLDLDFKKKGGFQRSIDLSKAYGLYRQNYCGCQFSKR